MDISSIRKLKAARTRGSSPKPKYTRKGRCSAGGAGEDAAAGFTGQGEAAALMLAVAQQRIAAGGGALIGRDAQHMQQGQHRYSAPGGVGLAFILTPVAAGLLQAEQLLHQRLAGYGSPRLEHFGVVPRPLQHIHQRPVAHGWILPLKQPGKGITF